MTATARSPSIWLIARNPIKARSPWDRGLKQKHAIRCPLSVAGRLREATFFAGAEGPTDPGRDSTQGQCEGLRLFNGSRRNFKAAIEVPLYLPTLGLRLTRLSLSHWLL